MTSRELVFVPAPGAGHIVSTIEFAKRLLRRHADLSVSVLCLTFSFTPGVYELTKSLLASQTRINLLNLPHSDTPPSDLRKSPEHFIYLAINSLVPHVRDAIRSIVSSPSRSVVGVVLDFFCMPMLDVANEFGLDSYMFMTSNLGFLSFMLSLPSRHNRISSEYEDSEPDLNLPGFSNPVPVAVLPSAAFNKHGGYTCYIKLAQRFRETKGIIVNSFSEIEQRSLEALSNDETTPPIFMVGPVLDLDGPANPRLDRAQRDKIMAWLDEQPCSSVVFLCFGSFGSFGGAQAREIATGLERSGQRFLWCANAPQGESMDEILPEGFVERVAGRGVVCEGWAPQVEVLAHSAVGGFVSHCGWNSILESLWFGVPIVTWPMYAEQQMNAFLMVKEFGLAVELRLNYRLGGEEGGVVAAEEIELAVRRVMEGESEVRKKVKEMSEMARNALQNGGSSYNAVGNFLNDVLGLGSI